MRYLSLVSLLLFVSVAQAQSNYAWRSVTVGGGGFIPNIVFSRTEKDLAYLRSDMGGCYRWDAAAKQWLPLQDAMAESSYFGGESIAIDPVDPNTVFIAAGMYRKEPSAILRSHDRGKTWETFPVTFKMGGNEEGRGVGERLAIDPNNPRVLFFGSREDGLQQSIDAGQTWHRVESFPLKGLGASPERTPMHAGLSFVVFSPSKQIFVGSADPGEHHLFESDDAGNSWKAVSGEPSSKLLAMKADVDVDDGVMYITYSNAAGPNGATDGAVMKLDTRSGKWTDITPQKNSHGGYQGISVDRSSKGTIGVTTLNRWNPGDTVWRTTDGGKTWHDIRDKATRDVTATPFLNWGAQSKLGWWMAAFAIDPFDSNHAVYATGATVYATNDFANVSNGAATHWKPWVAGIEQTAIITLCSPSDGAHLLSGFGDIGGFVHDDLNISPPNGMYEHPQFGNTNTIDFAELKPNVVVRSGRPSEGQADLAYSEDGGHSWQPIVMNPTARRPRREGDPAIIVSADGSTFIVMTSPVPKLTRDRGATWIEVEGLPSGARPVADRANASRFYAIDFKGGVIGVSDDGGATFAKRQADGLPARLIDDEPTWHEAAWPLVATPEHAGDLWLVSKSGLFHSKDGGKSFEQLRGDMQIDAISFGKAPSGQSFPAMFAIGTRGKLKAIWRSDDSGQSWIRVNDDEHQYGTRFRCIAGDPRVFGRVYVGTDGRGILYGEPAH